MILLLQDDSSDVRHRAAWALGEIGDQRAVEPLKSISTDGDHDSDGLYVVHADDDLKRLIGSRVVRIGELELAEALKRLASYVSQDNPMFVKAIGLYFLTFPDVLQTLGIVSDPQQVSMTIEERGGRRETVVLRSVPPSRPHKYLTPSEIPSAPRRSCT